MNKDYKIGQEYKINPFAYKGSKHYLAKFVGYVNFTEQESRDFPVFDFDFYSHGNPSCFMVLRFGKCLVVGQTVEEMMEKFKSKFTFIGQGYKDILVGDTKVDINDFRGQLNKTSLKDEQIDKILKSGRFNGAQGRNGEIKFCPNCKVIRDTSCCACGCGSCLVCNYRWSCFSGFDLPKIISGLIVSPLQQNQTNA